MDDDQIEKSLEEISHLDELIQKLYNAIYAKSGGRYETKFFDVSSLDMIRFKVSDYNLDTIFEKTPIQHTGNFPTGMIDDNNKSIDEIRFKRIGETHGSTIRIVPYASSDNLDNMKDPVNVNQLIRTLLSELVGNDRTNNLLLPIINVDVSGKDLEFYNKVGQLIDTKKYYSVQITEKYYSMMTLDSFLKEYPIDLKILKTIIYQAIDILYQINIIYPGFRYNQLFPQMIDCYLKQIENSVRPELKLGNFYLAQIDEIIPNDYLLKSKISIPNIGSQYSDLYQLLNYMWNNLYADIKKYPELISLFDIILPKKIRSDGMYLTEELWNKLSDEEKFDLRIKNLRNNTSFTTKDSLMNTQFVANGELSGGNSEEKSPSLDSEDLLPKANKEYFGIPADLTTDNFAEENSPISENIRIRANDRIDKDDVKIKKNSNKITISTSRGDTRRDYENNKSTTNINVGEDNNKLKANNHKLVIESKLDELETEIDDDSDDSYDWDDYDKIPNLDINSSIDIATIDTLVDKNSYPESDKEITDLNKKYYNNDIDNMSNKKSRKTNNTNTNWDSHKSSYSEDPVNEITEEQTEEREKNNRPRRIINISDSNYGKRDQNKNRSKIYKGKRLIGANTLNTGNDRNNQASFRKELYDAITQPSNTIPYDNSNYNNNSMSSRINSIGNMLGANPNDYMNRNGNTNYGQIAQQMAHQFQIDPNQIGQLNQMASPQTQFAPQLGQQMPSYLPQNIPSQIPMPIQNPTGQIMQQQQQPSDTDMLYRYLSATNQGPSQAQSQMDPSVMAALVQQQQQQQQMPQMGYQMGGGMNGVPNNNAKRNPFFFQ